MKAELVEPFALTVAYSFCEVLAPVFVVGLGARLYGFKREWQVLILSYVLTLVALVFVDFGLLGMRAAARTTYRADTPIYPTSYAFDVVRFITIFAVPLALTTLHIRDPRGALKPQMPERMGPHRHPFPFLGWQLPPQSSVSIDHPSAAQPKPQNRDIDRRQLRHDDEEPHHASPS